MYIILTVTDIYPQRRAKGMTTLVVEVEDVDVVVVVVPVYRTKYKNPVSIFTKLT